MCGFSQGHLSQNTLVSIAATLQYILHFHNTTPFSHLTPSFSPSPCRPPLLFSYRRSTKPHTHPELAAAAAVVDLQKDAVSFPSEQQLNPGVRCVVAGWSVA